MIRYYHEIDIEKVKGDDTNDTNGLITIKRFTITVQKNTKGDII
jgi:hypothetical protein